MIADFNKKANREFFDSNFAFRTAGIVFLIVIVVLAVADFKIYQKKRELASQVNAYQKQIEDIKKSSQTLKDEIANSDNKDYLEKLGYEQFDQARPGETEYMFINPPQKTEAGPEGYPVQKSSLGSRLSGWFLGAWNWIKSNF